MTVAETDALERALHDRFGLERFRPGQREVIEEVLRGRDVLCVMPTGGGKSLCYQLPAILLKGLTLVVSPLIALMKDQVDALSERGLNATLINSTLDPETQRARLFEIEAGRYDLVYVAPERFRSKRFLEAMAKVRPALLAVDEAHCISEWGHDFRPDYARLGRARVALGSPPCIALTATATDLVRRDIADQLDLKDPAQFVTGFDRPNLSYAVVTARRDSEKLEALGRVLGETPGSVIIYGSSRAKCEDVARSVEREMKRSVVVYHAGMSRDDRTSAQERFMRGEVDVVVATNAFGMGVDKADIRAVVHFNMPGTLEAYYQEAGRAGRDGRRAHCVMLFSQGDRFLQEMFIDNEYPPREAVYRVYETLRDIDVDPIELTLSEIKEAAGVSVNESAVGTVLRILEGAGAVERFQPRENMALVRINLENDAEPTLLEDRLHSQAGVQRVVLRAVEGLVNRRFGEPVYFHPDELASALGLDRTALGRALRNLATDLPIDYLPPFRGNAVRVIDRRKKPHDLVIDFAALEKRKKREYDKLDRMMSYARSDKCRRVFILNYFGDKSPTVCGRCDNCGGIDAPIKEAPKGLPVGTEEGRKVILKALSGVARAKGGFGKTAVAQMLAGSTAEKIEKSVLSRLSTYGVLRMFRAPEVIAIMDALISAGLVETREIEAYRPVVLLSERGKEYLKEPCELRLDVSADLASKIANGGLERAPAKTPGSEPATVAPPTIKGESSESSESNGVKDAKDADPLYRALKELRSNWARAAGVSPFIIFSNRTIEELTKLRPGTPADLGKIHGMSPSRLEKYGKAILDAIVASPAEASSKAPASPTAAPAPSPKITPLFEERVDATPAAAEPRPAAIPPKGNTPEAFPAHVPTEEWTRRLLDRGFSAEEAAAIRGLDLIAIIRHATLSIRSGRAVPLSAFIPEQTIKNWDHYMISNEEPPLEPTEVSRSLWSLFKISRSREKAARGVAESLSEK